MRISLLITLLGLISCTENTKRPRALEISCNSHGRTVFKGKVRDTALLNTELGESHVFAIKESRSLVIPGDCKRTY